MNSVTLTITVTGRNYEALQEAAQVAWRDFRNDPEAELPWQTEMTVARDEVTESTMDGKDMTVVVTYRADVTIEHTEQKR